MNKGELIELLEEFDDDRVICFGVNLMQGYVGFFDLEVDTEAEYSAFILKSPTLDKWYKDDIEEIKKEYYTVKLEE